jgi:UDP-glucose 4-epimerase
MASIHAQRIAQRSGMSFETIKRTADTLRERGLLQESAGQRPNQPLGVDVGEAAVLQPSNRLSGERILVTGASGFIGSHLCRRLCKAGAEVHAISRTKHSKNANGLRWWQGDLAELKTVQKLLATIKPDLIFHLASLVAGARDMDLVMPMLRSNFLSTLNLLTVAAGLGCRRFILTGSQDEPEIGDPEAVPCSPYAAAKWASSAYGRMFHTLYQLPVVMLRVFMVYGPAQQDLRKLIPYVTLSLLRGEAPKLSSGQRQVDWIYVEDVVEGLLAAAQAVGVEGKMIDIGSGTLVSVRNVVEQLVHLINSQIEPLFGAIADRPLEQVRIADLIESHTLIGWQPTIPLGEGLRRTVEWYAGQLRTGMF